MEEQAMAVQESNWMQTIGAAAESSMSQKDWCAAHGIAVSTFYRWKRILKGKELSMDNTGDGGDGCFAKLELSATAVCASRGEQTILLHVQDITVELSEDFSEEQLCRVLRAVRHAR